MDRCRYCTKILPQLVPVSDRTSSCSQVTKAKFILHWLNNMEIAHQAIQSSLWGLLSQPHFLLLPNQHCSINFVRTTFSLYVHHYLSWKCRRHVVNMPISGSNVRKFQKRLICLRHGIFFMSKSRVGGLSWSLIMNEESTHKKCMKKYLLRSKIIPLSDVKMQYEEFAIANLLLIARLKN